MCPSRNTWKRKPNGYKNLKENNLAISHPIFGPSLNLEAAVGSQKSAQALGAPGTIQKGLITTEVTTTFCIAPCTPISYTSFLRPTAVSRLNGPQSKHPQHSCAMPRVFLNRSVQIQPKSWREIVQVIFSQVLTKEGSEKPQKLPTRFGEEPLFLYTDRLRAAATRANWHLNALPSKTRTTWCVRSDNNT